MNIHGCKIKSEHYIYFYKLLLKKEEDISHNEWTIAGGKLEM